MTRIKHLESKFSIASYELIKTCEADELRFYLWLKLWAINKHEAFPSRKTIAKELGYSSPRAVARFISRLETLGRLKVTRKGNQNNLYDITAYDLLSLRSVVEDVEESRGGNDFRDTTIMTSETLPIMTLESPELKEIKTNRKKTISVRESNSGEESQGIPKEIDGKTIQKLIALFEVVNPSYKLLFPQISQRSAISRLVLQHGEETVQRWIEALPQVIMRPFAPRITTPCELERGLGKLLAFVAQEKSKLNAIFTIS